MKMWSKPQLTDLSVRCTEDGGLGGAPDGQVYTIMGFKMIGTSGPPLGPPFIKS
jgi:hypothetical protein